MDTPQILTKEQVATFLKEIEQQPSLFLTLALCSFSLIIYLCSLFMPLTFFPITVICLSITMTMFAVITHECAHLSLFPKRIVNIWIGYIAGVLCFTPFCSYQRGHRAHHNWVGSSLKKDPTPSPKKRVTPNLFLDILFKLRIPVFYWFGVYLPYLFYDLKPTARKHSAKHIVQFIVNIVFIIVFHYCAAIYLGANKYLLLVGCAFIGSGMIYEHLFTMTQHVGLQSIPEKREKYSYREQINFSRSVHLPLSVLFFHFNLHKEHHLIPGLNYQSLPILHEKISILRPDIFTFTSSEIRPLSIRKQPIHEVLSARKGDQENV
ncbi:fatty acid desaturase [Candidatus Uabimicrobium sp. HlEnr_7]|uniref:fatty acid desaturase family protein n=1 Tax=Candidatus Uabimicrobium helgolandensis TaxID=3095367 RepID=UPI003555E01E